ncbi:MAG: dihydroneopterin triphosphate 2'-epimerase [Plesiomonas sp.]|uniref:dihydroneopterin triphosphate 2'-epimerase n=1 Tax=Plesiomonas sp. TaxID=2486279 RepID=UPI003F3A09F9
MHSDAIIRIKNLRLRTYIGFNQEEINNKQDVVINAEIHYPATQASLTDNVANALNYRTITKKMIAHVENNNFLLLERLTKDLLDIASEHEWVSFAQVEVDKLHALRFADSVSMMLTYRKEAR